MYGATLALNRQMNGWKHERQEEKVNTRGCFESEVL